MKKISRVISKDEAHRLDALFWLERSPEERLSTLQLLREQRPFFPKRSTRRASRKRLRGVYRVTKQA
jgi:hypothetical protein